ncbi:hypothetical protein J5N97_017016 [Dioscorea zingiberensis]|uniref:Uncharacterized protein n=1 Tax=Dioscorea zingiberensis TaxID=325984 RepID=A0A9D5CKF4_9LILI|nr:hypothetical protein J5N97_017016 [Dioscorea zingiberensis]
MLEMFMAKMLMTLSGETASESDVGNNGRGEEDDDEDNDSEWKNEDNRKDKYDKASTKDRNHGYGVLLAEDDI